MGGDSGMTTYWRVLFQYILALIAFGYDQTYAQQSNMIVGRVSGPDKKPLSGATVSLKSDPKGPVISYSISRSDGRFAIQINRDHDGQFFLSAEHLGMKGLSTEIRISGGIPEKSYFPFEMEADHRPLDEVKVKAPYPPFSIRGDTVDFKASSYRTAESRKVEDLLKNIPGFDVSAEGKISFNGKPLERILIEGEDLTEKNYRLISRNLNAEMIDKVQVIHDFSSDRLMKGITHSGNIGINLTMDGKFKNRLSGGMGLAAGIGERESIDQNLARIGGRFKFLSFLNYNETGSNSGLDIQYHFDQDGDLTNGREFMLSKDIIQTGDIPQPPLENSYVRDNEDLSGFSIISCNVGKGNSLRMLFGKERSRLKKKASGSDKVFPPDEEPWIVDRNETYRSTSQFGNLRVAFSHDQGRDNTGSHSLEIVRNTPVNEYSNISSGAISDTLSEVLSGNGGISFFSGSESVRFGEGRVLKAEYKLADRSEHRGLHARTGRFRDYFKSDSNQIQFNQDLNSRSSDRQFQLSLYSRSNLNEWKSGIRIEGGRSLFRAHSVSMSEDSSSQLTTGNSTSNSSNYKTLAFTSLQRKLTKKTQLIAGINAGLCKMNIDIDQHRDSKTEFIYKAMAGLEQRIGHFDKLTISYDVGKALPERDHYHPAKLISGQATILDPARDLNARRNHSMTFSYSSNRLSKGSLLSVSANYSHTDGIYAYNSSLNPEYTFQYLMSTDNNERFYSNLRLEKFIAPVRTKVVFGISFSQSGSNLLFNGIQSRNHSRSLGLQQKILTAFKGPVNLEASFKETVLRNSTIPASGLGSSFSQVQYEAHGKLKINTGKIFYVALLYNHYLLAKGSHFHSMDMFVNLQTTGPVQFSLTASNLFNSTSLWERSFSVNSLVDNRVSLVGRYILFDVRFTF